MKFSIKDIGLLLQGTVEGKEDEFISNVGKIEEAKKGDIAFLANPKYESYIYDTNASAVIVNKEFVPKQTLSTTLIRVDDPYTCFTKLLEEYDKLINMSKAGIEEPSFIGNNSETGANIYRAAFSYIGSNCRIGKNVKIHPHVHIGDNVTVGDNTILFAGVKIYSNCSVGSRCTLHAGSVIGSDGFGFAPQADGSYKTIPQLGNVVIKDDVSIGANTVVDCATMGSTVIESGVKLDNLIQVAHNVEIGKNTVIAAQTGISGSTKIGEQCIFGGQVGIGGHVKIANNTKLAAKTGIIKTIRKEGEALVGQPGFPVKNYFKSYAVFKNLPEIVNRIEELEEKILTLRSE